MSTSKIIVEVDEDFKRRMDRVFPMGKRSTILRFLLEDVVELLEKAREENSDAGTRLMVSIMNRELKAQDMLRLK